MFMYSAHDYVLRVLTFTHLSLSLGMCVIGFFCTVFGESYDPSAAQEPVEKVVYPKSDEQRARLKSVMKGIFLFRALETEQENEVLDGIFERKVQPNDHIIDQGDDGDNFYVIDSGKYDIYVAASGEEPKLVGNYDNEGSFGELALMYNTPRAATIVATTEGVLWALDRKTFRRIICDAASRKRQTYHDLLESVPMLAQLEPYERLNLADALERKRYSAGDVIIRQGEDAHSFYLIEEGNVSVTMTNVSDSKEPVEVNALSKGQYFGELALLTNKPRAATVTAVGDAVCAVLDVKAFERLLGPCKDIMKRNIEFYKQQLHELFGSSLGIGEEAP
jgi:cAMP-dependent protein kinase regulator